MHRSFGLEVNTVDATAVLKGYMYLTRRHICFFAHMPDREVGHVAPSISVAGLLTRRFLEPRCQDWPSVQEIKDKAQHQVLGCFEE